MQSTNGSPTDKVKHILRIFTDIYKELFERMERSATEWSKCMKTGTVKVRRMAYASQHEISV